MKLELTADSILFQSETEAEKAILEHWSGKQVFKDCDGSGQLGDYRYRFIRVRFLEDKKEAK